MSSGKFAMTFVMLSIFVVMVGIATQYPPEARFMPFVVGIPAIALCLLQLFLDLRESLAAKQQPAGNARRKGGKIRTQLSRLTGRRRELDSADERPLAFDPAADPAVIVRREIGMWAYFLGLVGGVILFGFLLTVPVFVAVFLRYWAKTSWAFALGMTGTASVVLYMIFVEGLAVVPHPGFVTEYLLERLSG